MRRQDSIERKLDSANMKSEARLAKLEVVHVEREFAEEHVLRGVGDIKERINREYDRMATKLDRAIEFLVTRVDAMDGTLNDVSQRLRTLHEEMPKRMDSMQRTVSEMQQTSRSVDNQVNNRLTSLQRLVERTEASISAAAADMIIAANASLATRRAHMHIQSLPAPVTTTSSQRLRVSEVSHALASTVNLTVDTNTNEMLQNISLLLSDVLESNDLRFRELDEDVEIYTRKVMNNIQELTRTVHGNEVSINKTAEFGNRTAELVKDAFRELLAQVSPILPQIEPKLVGMRQSLDEKLRELTSSVDHSYTSILLAQNSFIDSCKRIQDEEAHLYHAVEEIVDEVRNTSHPEMTKLTTAITERGTRIDERLDKVYHLLVKVVKKLKQEKAFEDPESQSSSSSQLPRCRLDNDSLAEVMRICRTPLS